MTKAIKKQDMNKFLFEQEDDTFTLVERDHKYAVVKGEKHYDDKIMDPAQYFDFAKQVEADSQIKDTVTSPFNSTHFCQTLINPLTRASDESYEIITVQRVNENIRQYNESEHLEQELYLTCNNSEHKLVHQKKKDETRFCDYCKKDYQSSEFLRCTECEKFDICFKCQYKSFVRRNIEQQTSRHRFYEDYIMQSSEETSKDNSSESFSQENDAQLDKLEKNSRKYNERKDEMSQLFANVTVDTSDKEMLRTNPNSSHAVIGMWRKNKQDQMGCYRTFVVNQPVFFNLDPKLDNDGLNTNKEVADDTETLLHVGEQNQIYLFRFNDQKQVSYVEIDVEKAMEKKGHLQRINLESITKPVKKNVTFSDVPQRFLQKLCRIDTLQTVNQNTLPKLYQTQDTTLLCFFNPYKIDKDFKFEDKNPKDKIEGSSSLIFIDLAKPDKIIKIVQNAYLLLSINQDEQQGLCLWYYRRDFKIKKACDDSIVNVMWDNLPGQEDKELLDKAPQFIKSFKIVINDAKLVKSMYDYWKKSIDIQGRMSQDISRCIIVFGSIDYLVFQLEDDKIKKECGQAKLVLEHSPANDCKFAVMEDDPQATYIICNLHQVLKDPYLENDDNQNLTNAFTLEIFNFDTQKLITSYQNSDNSQDLQELQIQVTLPSSIKIYGEQKGKLFAPYKFMQYQLFKKKEANTEIVYFVNSLFYTDHNNQELRMAFICGSQQNTDLKIQDSNVHKIKHQTDCQVDRNFQMNAFKGIFEKKIAEKFRIFHPQNMAQTEFKVQWPILIKNHCSPLQNVLTVSNLVQNIPQIKLNLGNYSFLKFVDVGQKDPLQDNVHTLIYFLVLTPERDAVRLMYYKTFAWPVAEKNTQIVVQNPAIHIVAGTVCSYEDKLFKDITVSNIYKACLLHHKQADQGVQVSVVIQLSNKIAAFNLNTTEPTQLLCDKKDEEMACLSMLCDPHNLLYYVKRSPLVDKVMAIYLRGSKIQEQKVHERTSQILYMQLSQTKNRSASPSLLVLTNNSNLIEMGAGQFQNNFGTQVDLEEKSKFKVRGADNLFVQLQSQNWQKLVISHRMITCQKEHIDNLEDWEPHGLISYNLKSQSRIEHEFLDFKTDSQQKLFLTGAKKSENIQIASKQCVKRIELIENMNKTISIVQEGRRNYFMVSQSFDNRLIELFDHNRCDKLIEDVKFVGNRIAVSMPGQTLFFNQKDMMLNQVQTVKLNKMNEQSFSQHIEKEYFKFEIQPKGDKYLIKIDENNKQFKVVRAQPKTDHFKTVRADIEKIFVDMNYKKLEPFSDPPILDNDESLVQIFTFQDKIPQLKQVNELQGFGSAVSKVSLHSDSYEPEQDVDDQQETKLQTFIYKFVCNANPFTEDQKQNFAKNNLTYCDNQDGKQKDVYYVVRWEGQKKKIKIATDFAKNKLSYCQTSDFLVLKEDEEIHFWKLKDIKEANEKALKKLNNTKSPVVVAQNDDNLKQPLLNLNSQIKESAQVTIEDIKNMANDNLCEVQMQSINIKDFLNDRIKQGGFKVTSLNKNQTKYSDHLLRSKNLIQIMFSDLSLVWDLDNNKQVHHIVAPQHFSMPRTFSILGINTNVNELPLNTLDINNGPTNGVIEENQEQSLFLYPKVKSAYDFSLFRTFTLLDLFEISTHLKLLKKHKYPTKIDPEALLVNLYGTTYFEIMREDPHMFQIIKKQLDTEEDDYKRFFNKFNVEYDHEFIRRLHITLNIPLQKTTIHDPTNVQVIDKVQENTYKNSGQHNPDKEDLPLLSFLLARHKNPYPFKNNPEKISLLHEALRADSNQNRSLLENLLGLFLKSNEVQMKDMIDEFEDFTKSFNYSSKEIDEFLEVVFQETEVTRTINYLEWESELDQIAFGANSSFYNSDFIKKKITEQQINYEKRLTFRGYFTRFYKKLELENERIKYEHVQLKVLDISWLNNQMGEFFYFMSDFSDQSIYDMKIVKVLLKEQDYSVQLTQYVFLPWCFYFLVSLIYLTTLPQKIDQSFSILSWIMRIIMCTGIIRFMSIEIQQIMRLGIISYLADFWNWVYLFIYSFNIAVIVENIFSGAEARSEDLSSTLASINVMLLWIGLFYWLRLFKSFSKYIFLILETFSDIGYFLFLFFLILFCFANGLYILDCKTIKYTFDFENHENIPNVQPSITTGGKVVDQIFGNGFMDTLVNQYLLGLGEFAIDTFEGSPHEKMIWIMFICATFITNIVFLNMLIAIMGDTYNKVSDDWDRNALIERTCIFADHWPLITLSKKFQGQQFLYVTHKCNELDQKRETVIDQIYTSQKKKFATLFSKLNEVSVKNTLFQTMTELSLRKQESDIQTVKDSFKKEINVVQNSLHQMSNHLQKLIKNQGIEES